MASFAIIPIMKMQARDLSAGLTKAKHAYRSLKKMIVDGGFAKRRWSVRLLASKLGMSVVPVSEALRRLEQEQLIDIKPQSGIHLRRMSTKELAEAMLFRQALECQAARIVSAEGNQKILADLESLAALVEDRRLKQGQAGYLDYQFHQRMVAGAGCELLVAKFDEIATRCLTKAPGHEGWPPVRWPDSEQDHLKIVRAIQSRSPAQAQRAIRNHIRAERIMSAIKE